MKPSFVTQTTSGIQLEADSAAISESSAGSAGVRSFGPSAVVLLATTMLAAGVYVMRSPMAGLALFAAGAVCAWLMLVPPFWTAAVLIVLVPFHQLISALLSGQGGNRQQISAPWLVLLLLGIVQALNSSSWKDVKNIAAANRSLLFWSGLLMLAYVAAFVWAPGVPALSGLNLGTRYLAVMFFFLLLRADRKRVASLLRLMLWSAVLMSAYGLVQYFWDYDRLLPFLPSDTQWGLFFEDERRIYSYSFSAFEPAYTAVIGILILFSRSLRCTTAKAWFWVAILFPCLLLTYTRSAYIALAVGVAVVCTRDRIQMRRAAAAGGIALGLAFGLLLVGGDAVAKSSLGQRIESIVSQKDFSSVQHKDSIIQALRDVSANPLGIGLGKSGISAAKYQGSDKTRYIENWPLQLAADAGVMAAIAFIGLSAAVLWSLFRKWAGASGDHTLQIAAMSIFAAMSIASIVAPVWVCEATCLYTWAIVGMALAPVRNTEI